jgi:aarF domain-containing kinase
LYARRIIEIAAASATLLVNRTRLQEALQETPKQWVDWEQKDWTHSLLTSLGGTPLSQFWMAGKRLVNLTLLATPLVLLAPLSLVSQTAHNLSWDYALWGIEQAGPTFIKLVQWATTRQDMFSQEFCSHFGKLRDETRGHSWEETLSILREELGEDYHQLIELETTPIGLGCIAQVYRGHLLKPTSAYPQDTEVALKVCVVVRDVVFGGLES